MFWAVSPHLLSQNGKIWREGANLGDRPQAKFCKNSLKGIYPFWADLYKKNTISVILGAVLPHFLTHSDEIWHEGANLGLPPPSHILLKKSLKGYTRFGQIYTKNCQF